MYSNVNSFSEPNFRSQAVALIASNRWLGVVVKSRCTRLLPPYVNSDQYQALKIMLRQRICQRDFLTQFDCIFNISIWQSLDAKLYSVLLEPIVEAFRSLLR